MSENQTEDSAILQELRQIKAGQTTLQTKADKIETALYGTGNPHGGLFQQFAALDGKIDGVEGRLKAKIDAVEEIFSEMFRFAKWGIGIAVVLIGAVAIPILLEVVLPITKKWIV